MTCQRSCRLSAPLLAAALALGASCRGASSPAPPPDKAAPAGLRYAILGLPDTQSAGPAVGLNNRGEIVFQGGDVYWWNGSALTFEHSTFGGVVPSHVEYEPGKKPNERIGHVIPAVHDPLTAADIDDAGDVLGTSRAGLFVWQRGAEEGPVADVIIPNPDPDSLSSSAHGQMTGGLNNRQGVVGGLEVLLPSGREKTFFYWQSGVTSDFEAALATFSKDTAAPFPATALEDYEYSLPTLDGLSFNPSALNDAGEIAGTVTAATKSETRRSLLGPHGYSFHINSVPMPLTFHPGDIVWPQFSGGGFSTTDVKSNGRPAPRRKPKRHVNVLSMPAFWDGHRLKLLTLDDGASDGCALGLNKSHDAVGFERGYLDPDDDDRVEQIAVEWQDGTAQDLNAGLPPASGWKLTRAVRINDSGEIIGEGLYNGVRASFLLIPLPSVAAVPTASLPLPVSSPAVSGMDVLK